MEGSRLIVGLKGTDVDICDRDSCRTGCLGFEGGLIGALPFAMEAELELKSKTS